jgi:hypothetical protein
MAAKSKPCESGLRREKDVHLCVGDSVSCPPVIHCKFRLSPPFGDKAPYTCSCPEWHQCPFSVAGKLALEWPTP